MNLLEGQKSKDQKFVIDKIFHPLDVHFDTNSLSAWIFRYAKPSQEEIQSTIEELFDH